MVNDRRDNPRMPVVLDAILNYRSTAVMCTVRDISLNGAFIEAQPGDLPYSGKVELGITVSSNGSPKYYRLNGTIRRLTDSGAAISFAEADRGSEFSLVDLVSNG